MTAGAARPGSAKAWVQVPLISATTMACRLPAGVLKYPPASQLRGDRHDSEKIWSGSTWVVMGLMPSTRCGAPQVPFTSSTVNASGTRLTPSGENGSDRAAVHWPGSGHDKAVTRAMNWLSVSGIFTSGFAVPKVPPALSATKGWRLPNGSTYHPPTAQPSAVAHDSDWMKDGVDFPSGVVPFSAARPGTGVACPQVKLDSVAMNASLWPSASM